MIDESSKKTKLSWPKTLKKLFTIKTKAADCYTEDDLIYQGGDEQWTNNFQEEAPTIKKNKRERTSKGNYHCYQPPSKTEFGSPQATNLHNYRIFAATWNVAGKSPTNSLNLEDWLHTSPPADIYVLGFQEIVPLNAGNVLGTEDNGPARKWLELIDNTLNNLDADSEGSMAQKPSSLFNSCSFQSMRMMETDMEVLQPRLDRRFSVCDRVMFSDYDPLGRWCGSSDEDPGSGYSPDTNNYLPVSCVESSKYSLVVSKQMVGVFLTVWVKTRLKDDIHNIKVSCVGRGLMGYLGNKGSISISMALHQTSFCFVCSHLTSGQKDGDELRRNSDVMEILKKTRFPRLNSTEDRNSPRTILEHDRIIWLGDLNYRIALSYTRAKALVEMRNWRALLANDQLRIEQRQGRVFEGWKEGKIHFPPTYKYSNNSDRYACDDIQPKEKRRTPAWCDRILWNGKGLHQMCYVRGESRFSDHRPVYSVFLAEVESSSKKNVTCLSSRVEVEELLPYSDVYGGLNCY